MKTTSKLPIRSGIAFCVAWISAAALPALAQRDPPSVRVHFAMEARDFVENFDTPASRDQFEQDITSELLDRLRDRFGFLAWESSAQASADPRAAELKLTMKAKRPIGLTDIVLQYSASVGGQAINLSRIPDERLYRASDQQPTSDHSRLRTDLLAAFDAQLNNDQFLFLLQDQFLQTVPLVDEIVVLGSDHRVVIPLVYDALGPPSDLSVLRVEFTAKRPSENLKSGMLKLVPLARLLSDPMPGAVECSIRKFSFAPFDESAWHPEIPVVLGFKVGTLRVFMERYHRKPSPGTSGGIVTDLGGGH